MVVKMLPMVAVGGVDDGGRQYSILLDYIDFDFSKARALGPYLV